MPASVAVLVVDDSVTIRAMMSRVLQEDPTIRVSAARSGEEAEAMMARERFDVVTLDVEMPGMGGLELLARLRRRDDDIPVVMLSASTGAGAVARRAALKAGAVGCFDKADALREAVALRTLVKQAAAGKARLSAADRAVLAE